MDFNLKNYRILKTKKKLKNSKLLLFFNSAKLKATNWVLMEKKLKILKLNYSKIFNKTTLKTIDSSIYKNMTKIISSVVLIIEPTHRIIDLNILKIKKELRDEFVVLFLKLNNKIYAFHQFKSSTFLYKKNVLDLSNCLEKSLKTTYRITQKNRNNVI